MADGQMAIWGDEVKSRVLDMIRATPRAEVIKASEDRIEFRGKAPLMTFEVICEGADRFRVKETTGFQTAGRPAEPTPHGERDIITQSKMITWVTQRLKELAASG